MAVECDICGRMIQNSQALKIHKRWKHIEDEPIQKPVITTIKERVVVPEEERPETSTPTERKGHTEVIEAPQEEEDSGWLW